MERRFVHLHNHTMYSLLDGACRLTELVEYAQKLNMPAVAMTDHGNMFGALEFYLTAKKSGVHPIIGQEFYVAEGSRKDKGDKEMGMQGGYHLTILAANNIGYHNLIRLSSAGFVDGFYYKPRIDKEILQEYYDGLFVLSGCLRGEIPTKILRGDYDGAKRTALWFKEVFGEDKFFIELQNHGIPDEEKVLPELVKLARELGIKMVATNDVHYIKREDADFHDKMLCIQTDKTVDDKNRMRFYNDQFYLKSAQEMEKIFGEVPEALENTMWIAERCDVSIEIGKLKLPRFSPPEEFSSVDQYLEYRAKEGLKKRYSQITKKLAERLDYELRIIKEMNFSGYFAIVADFTDTARKMGVRIGPGRGSGAGSLVAYTLGITNIDPMKYDLLFERFLNPERVNMPDIDIDFDDLNREKVIEYAKKKYGEDAVCQIITFNTLKARAAIKDIGRIFNLPFKDVNEITSLIPEDSKIFIDEALSQSPQLKRLYDEDPTVRKIIDYARKLEGLPRNASVHAAGVVITPGKLTDYVPLFRTSKKEITTQFEKDALEKIGLLKMDFLGLTTLSIINEALNLIEKGSGKKIDIEKIPEKDKKVFKIFSKGETIGIFQFESEGMRRYLKQLKPDSIEDLIAMNALYRPGPMQYIDSYIARKHGKEKVRYPHPDVEDVLKSTYGIAIYQEQVMLLAQRLAGYSLGEADILRRAIGKKKAEIMSQQRNEFISRAVEKGLSEKVAKKVFDIIEEFAGYGFNKSHSAAYSVLSYQTAYLKCYYPEEFMAANLTFAQKSEDINKFLNECRRMKIKILPPDVNKSSGNFIVEEKGVRFGLSKIKNVGQGTIDSIIEARERVGGKFSDIYQFLSEVDASALNKKAFQSLINAGAFDSLNVERSTLYASSEMLLKWRHKKEGEKKALLQSLFDGDAENENVGQPNLLDVPRWTPLDRLSHEREVLGVYLSGHPLEHFKDELRAFTSGTIEEVMEKSAGKVVRLAGLLTKYSARTKKDGTGQTGIGFLQDITSQIKVIFYSQVMERDQFFLTNGSLLWLEGRLRSDTDNTVVLIVDKVIPLEQVRESLCQALHIRFPADMDEKSLNKIKKILEKHAGNIPLHLHIIHNDRTYKARSLECSTDVSKKLLEGLRKILGENNVWIS